MMGKRTFTNRMVLLVIGLLLCNCLPAEAEFVGMVYVFRDAGGGNATEEFGNLYSDGTYDGTLIPLKVPLSIYGLTQSVLKQINGKYVIPAIQWDAWASLGYDSFFSVSSKKYAIGFDDYYIIQVGEGDWGPPNLVPYKPNQWSDDLIVATQKGATTDASSIRNDQDVFVSSAVLNDARTDIKTPFVFTISVDGSKRFTFTTDDLLGGYYLTGTDANIGRLSAGKHTLTLAIDPANAVKESNEKDNSYSKTITVGAAPATLALLRVSKADSKNTKGIDDPIIPIADPSALAGCLPLGKGAVADGVTPVLVKITGVAGEKYGLKLSFRDPTYNSSILKSKTYVLYGGSWEKSDTVTLTDSGVSTGIGYACISGFDWNIFGAGAHTPNVILDVDVYPKSDSTKTCTTNIVYRPPPVVLVHGINSDATCWTASFKSALSDAWPGEIMSFSYGVGSVDDKKEWPCTTDSLENLAKYVDTVLTDYVEAGLKQDWAFTRYDVVGHSQGGVLLRMLCQTNKAGFGQFTAHGEPVVSERNSYRGRFRRVITIGSPHNGSLYGWWSEQWFKGQYRPRIIDNIAVIYGGVPVKSWPKFDPFFGEIRNVNSGDYPVDARIKFNCICTTIYRGNPPTSGAPSCYSSIGLCDTFGAGRQTRGEVLLPNGSDGVVDFKSQGGGPGTQDAVVGEVDIAHCDINTKILGFSLTHQQVYGVGPDAFDYGSPVIAQKVGSLLNRSSSAFGAFKLPTQLSQRDLARYLALLPNDSKLVPIQAGARSLFHSDVASTQSFDYRIATNFPVIGKILWRVMTITTNGISTNGINLQATTNDQTRVTVSVENSVSGDVLLWASYTSTNNLLVSGGPIVVASRPQATLKGIQISSTSTPIAVGQAIPLGIVGIYGNGVKGPLFVLPGQGVFSTTKTNVAIVNSNGIVSAVGLGTARITLTYKGVTATTDITVSGPSIIENPKAQRVMPGGAVMFRVGVSGGSSLQFQWRKNGSPLTSNKRTVGVADSTMSLASVAISDAGTYDVVITSTSGAITSAPAILTVPETNPPSILIASPKANGAVSNAMFIAAGTAVDNAGVTAVYYSLNGGSWTLAQTTNRWSNWSANLNLSGKSNVLQVYAVDINANTSKTASVNFTYIRTAPLGLAVSGTGTILLKGKPITNQFPLVVGTTYTITAQPGAGCVFSNWTGSVRTNSATISFVMQPGLSVTAGFLDTTRPSVVISTPRANAVATTNALVRVAGTANDNSAVMAVRCQLNNGTWTVAYGTTNWQTFLRLALGTNTIRVCAVDSAGHYSLTNTLTIRCTTNKLTSLPYTGVPQTVPGRIRLDLFDGGGEGVAYHDIEQANLFGGAFRPNDGVDINYYPTPTNACLGWTMPGEWINYSVNVKAKGTYSIQLGVANTLAGGVVHVECDGTNVTGQLSLPNTGSFATYVAIGNNAVPLTAGNHVLRLVMERSVSGGVGAIASFVITNAPAKKLAAGLAVSTPVAKPRMEVRTREDRGIELSWPAVIGATYQVQSAETVDSDSWTDIGDPQMATDDVIRIWVPVDQVAMRFYRILVAQ